MAQSLSSTSQVSNLVLRRGRGYVMYKQFNSRELFQILTPRPRSSSNTTAWP